MKNKKKNRLTDEDYEKHLKDALIHIEKVEYLCDLVPKEYAAITYMTRVFRKKLCSYQKVKELALEGQIQNNVVKCYHCKKEFPVDKVKVHAKVHTLDHERYLNLDNLTICCISCYKKQIETYELENGSILKYRKS